ncbi:MAG: polysulfide reductase NrfD [Desulfitobacteriaceae bacterium]|nr:polysulfide reductase NrfD [Desulfitobacteriaceae bacterium]MDI6879419.1 polysulfide reductase NrfD [Desulfitobacteriaceae bacterium]MDI6914697.1 polysulfide reductase NrfD [Desulfitobacteriaceae bacterium]
MDVTWGAGVSHEIAWGGLIAIYLFLAGVAGGAFLTAALTDLLGKKGPSKVVRSGAYIAPVSIIIGLALLVFDLGRPFSFWKLLFNVNFGSVMSIGVFIISIFTALSVVYAYLIWVSSAASGKIHFTTGAAQTAASVEVRSQGLHKAVAIFGVVFAVGTATYTGFLLSAVSTNVFWSTPLLGIQGVPFLPFLFLVSALSTGLAAAMIGAFDSKDLTLYKKVDIVLIALELILLVVLYASVKPVFFGGNLATLFWLGVVLIGLLVPFVLTIYGVMRHKNLVLPVSSMVVLGGVFLRYFIVYAGQILR